MKIVKLIKFSTLGGINMKEFIKEEIHSVHDKDLEKILDGLSLLNKFKSGKLKCKFCHETVNFNNLHSFFPEAGRISFACDRPDCIKELYSLLREDKISI